MKKVLKSLALTGSMLAIAATAHAATTVQVTLTSPSIVKHGCERVGTVSMDFPPGTVLSEGDWFYMDLPANTSICKPIDYFIANGRAVGSTADKITFPAAAGRQVNGNVVTVDKAGAITTIPVINPAASVGPLSNVATAGAGLPTSNNGTGGVVLRVLAPKDGRRVWVYVYGDQAGVAGQLVVPVPGVGVSSKLTLRVLDGKAYNGSIIINTTAAGANPTATVWGDTTTDDINVATAEPHVEDTLCANAEQMSGDLMFTSFNSLASFLTFTGDSQIAHTVSANTISLLSCAGKTGPTTGNILISPQKDCSFKYDDATNYCKDAVDGTKTVDKFLGNRFLIANSTTFGDPGDRYDMTITSKDGVYFQNNGVGIIGHKVGDSTDTDCTAVNKGTAVVPVTAFNHTLGTSFGNWPGIGCSVKASDAVTVLTTGATGSITGIDTYDTLEVTMPTFVYDTGKIGNGTETTVTIALDKYPCGNIFSATRTIGTFVTTCPMVNSAATTLLYPFLPNMDGSLSGWWGGFTIVNGGDVAGTCALTFTDANGDQATMTTPSIAPAGMWAGGGSSTLAGLTKVGTSGSVGDANVSVVAKCAFGKGGGFAFTGNGNEGTGYTAYVLNGNSWQ